MRALARALLLALVAARHGDEFHVGAGGGEPTPVKDGDMAIEANLQKARAALRAHRNVELRAAVKEDPSSLSADDLARAEQLMARDARKAAQKKAARGGDSGSR